MIIEYYIKSIYGNDLIYIKNATQGKALQVLTNKKTIDKKDIDALQVLGVVCVEVLR